MGNGKNGRPPGGPQEKTDIEVVLDRIGRRIRELRSFDPTGIQDRWDTRLEVLQKNVNNTIADAVGMGSAQYRQLAIGPLDAALESAFGDRFTLDEMREELRKAVGQAVMRLNAAAKVLERRLAGAPPDSSLAPLGDAPASSFGALPSSFGGLPSGPAPLSSGFGALAAEPPAPSLPAAIAAPAPAPAAAAAPVPAPSPVAGSPTMDTSPSTSRSARIAIVCRDDAAGEALTSFVAQLGLEPVIAQQPLAQASSLESLEALRQADYAVVLQADRQLEIGFLLGALGRARLCVLQAEGQGSLPGLAHQAFDEGGLWRLLLAREMKKAGLDVDLNKAL